MPAAAAAAAGAGAGAGAGATASGASPSVALNADAKDSKVVMAGNDVVIHNHYFKPNKRRISRMTNSTPLTSPPHRTSAFFFAKV